MKKEKLKQAINEFAKNGIIDTPSLMKLFPVVVSVMRQGNGLIWSEVEDIINQVLSPKDAKISIFDWFDPYNIKHIEAFRYFQKNGKFPDGFLPNNIKQFEPNIEITLTDKITNTWIHHLNNALKTNNEKIGSPPENDNSITAHMTRKIKMEMSNESTE